MDNFSDSELSSLASTPSPPPTEYDRCSSPLSELSRSPSPPPTFSFDFDLASMANRPKGRPKLPLHAYPSPPASQQTSTTGSPTPDGMESGIEGRPAKRRRISRDPKDRTTEYLDLRSGTVSAAQQDNLDLVLDVLHKRRKIVAIAGAGMSKSAGIPDFRSTEGLFSTLKKEHNLKGSGQHLFDASVYKDDASTEQFHSMISRMSRLTQDAKPTPFHHMLATMAKDDRLLRLYSQNVDGLDTNMEPLATRTPLSKDENGKWPRTVQLHGGLDKMVCTKCGAVSQLNADLFDGSDAPLCSACETLDGLRTEFGKRSHGVGRLRPRMVLYHEQGPDETAIGTCSVEDLRRRPDAVIVVGTTLKVPGLQRLVREMCKVVRNRKDGGLAIWINPDPPPAAGGFRDCFDIIVQGTCDDVAERAAMRKWDEPDMSGDFSEVSEAEAVKISAKRAQVMLPKCQLEHAAMMKVPSPEHKNNSFKPPPRDVTPPPTVDLSPDYSPMSSRQSSIVDSIEKDDNITLAEIQNGLATPSKSSEGTPAETKQFMAQFKQPGKVKNPASKAKKPATSASKTASDKKTAAGILKGVKPKSKSKAKPQQPPAKTASIATVFGQSKSASTVAKNAVVKKDGVSPAKKPSKLMEPLKAAAATALPAKGKAAKQASSKAASPKSGTKRKMSARS
ncbi:hypothetical protein LTR15_005657 [Elasticomyces elasticus]|nr:hypothetical protein LTR15_005657 [Elasticomyces elasticus]